MVNNLDHQALMDEDFDNFLDMLRDKLSNPRTHVLNPQRVKDLEIAYKAISKIIMSVSPDAKITIESGKLTPTHASIIAETDEIIVQDIKSFISGIESANNFEIYPLTNGNIKIAISFYNVMDELSQLN